jgi:hypothetical protein
MKRSIFFHGLAIAVSLVVGLASSAIAATSRIANFAIALVREGFPPPDPRAHIDRLILPQARQIIGLPQVRAFLARLLARVLEHSPRRDLSGVAFAS